MKVFTLNGLPAEYKGLDWDEILKKHRKVCLAERKKRLADPTCKGSKITGEILPLYEELNHKSLDFRKCYKKILVQDANVILYNMGLITNVVKVTYVLFATEIN